MAPRCIFIIKQHILISVLWFPWSWHICFNIQLICT